MNGSWPSWVEVRLDNIVHNVREIRNLIGPDVKLLAVVKANGYGHGGIASSWAALKGGADFLGVGSAQEGVELFRAGISENIVVLGGCFEDQADMVVDCGLIQAVHNRDILQILNRKALRAGKIIRVHLKVDTGMGRLGFRPEEALKVYKEALNLKGIKIEGLLSHLAISEESSSNSAEMQIGRFNRLRKEFLESGAEVKYWHICNSGGTVNFPEAHHNMVRCGLLIYGLYPFINPYPEIQLKPALTWKSRIVSLKKIYKGESVSYGGKWRAEKDELIGVVPLGYHDGFDRKFFNKAELLVGNRRVSVVGDICMDNLMIRVTECRDLKIGDEVILIGRSGDQYISFHEMAERAGTISYEIMSRIGRRVARIYLWKEKRVAISTFLNPVIDTEIFKRIEDSIIIEDGAGGGKFYV